MNQFVTPSPTKIVWPVESSINNEVLQKSTFNLDIIQVEKYRWIKSTPTPLLVRKNGRIKTAHY